MNCPKCGGDSAIINTRMRDGAPHRRRECVSCPTRWSTSEAVIENSITLRPLSEFGRPKPVLKRAKSKGKQQITMPKEAAAALKAAVTASAAAAGLTVGKFNIARNMARREAVKNGKPVERVYESYGVLTLREKALLTSDKRPTVSALK